MVDENDKIPLDDTKPTIKNEQDTLTEKVVNETDLSEEYYSTQDEEQNVLA